MSGAGACPICEACVTPAPYLAYEKLEWVRCPKCGGGWLTNYVSELQREAEDFSAFYQGYNAVRALHDAVAEEKARWVLGHWTEDMLIVEVGPALGCVALAVRRLNPAAPVLLVEPWPGFASVLRAAGFEVFGGSPEQALTDALSAVRARGKRLLVLMDNVLEHVPYPARYLAAVHAGSLAGSKALVEVPNEQGLHWRTRLQDLLRGARKPPTFPGHINLFTRLSLDRLVRQATGAAPVIRGWPIRRTAQVAYLSQDANINWKVQVAIGMLRVLPIDTLLGVDYWLRAEIPIGKSGAPAGSPQRSSP